MRTVCLVFVGILLVSFFGCAGNRQDAMLGSPDGKSGEDFMGHRDFGPGRNFTKGAEHGNFTGPMPMREGLPDPEMMQNFVGACSEKSEGDSCSLETPRGLMNGICSLNNGNLMCRPEGPREAVHP